MKRVSTLAAIFAAGLLCLQAAFAEEIQPESHFPLRLIPISFDVMDHLGYHGTLLEFGKLYPAKNEMTFTRWGVRILEAYNLQTGRYSDNQEFMAFLVPSIEIGKKLKPGSNKSISFYGSFGFLSFHVEHFVDVGAAFRYGPASIKAGVFRTRWHYFQESHLDDFSRYSHWVDKIQAATYISIGITPFSS